MLLYGTIPLALMSFVVSIVVMSALSTVFQTALYRHASGLQVAGFDQQLMQNAFTHGKNYTPPRPSRPSDLRWHEQQSPMASPQPGATPPPPAAFDGPQDWSQLPDEWTR